MAASPPPFSLDGPEILRRFDRLGMAKLLRDFPQQIEEAVRIGEAFSAPASLQGSPFEKIAFFGMGGSAIGGDVIRSLAAEKLQVPVWICRHYRVPPFIDSKTLCVFSSYSGNTEETLSSFQEGMKRKLKGVVITSGGALARQAERYSVPWIRIASGYPPRAALGYSVFPMLKIFSKLGLWPWEEEAIQETLVLLRKLVSERLGPEVPQSRNPAKRLAQALHGRFVAIYAGTELLDTAALRFRNQIEENAKTMASHHLLPEMNHNEILGWKFPPEILKNAACVFLRDSEDHPRIQLRMEITKELIAGSGARFEEIISEGKSRLARLFSSIYIGDWASFYLALLYGVEPTPVAIIELLKQRLAQVKF